MRLATGQPGSLPQFSERSEGQNSHAPMIEGKSEQVDPVAVAEMIAHLRDFGISSFAQIATLTEEGLIRRLGYLGGRFIELPLAMTIAWSFLMLLH